MKKSSLLLALLLAISVMGCSGEDDTQQSSSITTEENSSSVSSSPPPTTSSQTDPDTTSSTYLITKENMVSSDYFGFAFTLPENYRHMSKGEVSTAFGLAGESYDKSHEEKTAAYIINSDDVVTMEIIVQDTDLTTQQAEETLENALGEVFITMEKEPEIAFFSSDWGKIHGTTTMQGNDKQVKHYILVRSIDNKLCQITISSASEKDLLVDLSTAFSQLV